jgi:pSer/pThr/pTyr-binding forkhead associated (FHA) protein
MKVVLELQEQSSNIRRVTVRHDIVIGRGSDCNLRVSAPQVSRRHCFLRIDSAGVAITDLESCNGTWLNGQKTIPGKRYFIEDGMNVAVGPVCFVARISANEIENPDSNEEVTQIRERQESAQSLKSMPAGSMDFAIEHAGDAGDVAENDDLTVDYSSHAEEMAIEHSEIEIIGGDSEEVILIDDATEVIDPSISVEAVEMAAAVIEVIDDEEILTDEDGVDALKDFLRDNH